MEIETEQGRIKLYKWAKLKVLRENETLTVYANDVKEGDEILLDNRDRLWTLKEIIQ
jgi:hypothetical protein